MEEEMVGLIPAAGGGTRLYPFSRAVPKEMYPVMGKPAIEHSIETLREGGIKKSFLVVGHQKGALMDYIGDGRNFGMDIAYIHQHVRKGLGHAILQGRTWIEGPFVVMLGDSFIEPKEEVREIISLHRKEKPIATILLFEVEDPEGYGIVKLEGNRVEELIEKPGRKEAEGLRTGGKLLAITGLYVFESRIYDYIERTGSGASGEIQVTDALRLAVKNGEKVIGLVLKGRYLDMGRWRTVLEIEKEMASKMDMESQIRERERLMEMGRE